MRAFGRVVSVVTLGASLSCGRSVRLDDAAREANGGQSSDGPTDAGSSDAAASKGPCGAAQPLCDVDRCAGGECAFVEIGRLPESVWGVYPDEGYLYAIAEQGTTIFRIPKCGGGAEVIVRTVGNIDGLAISGGALYWTLGAGSSRRLYRTPKDGSGRAEELTLEGRAPDYSSLTADAIGAYVVRSESPGIVRYDATGVVVLEQAPVRATLRADREFLYTTNYDEGTRRVSKADGTNELVLAPGELVVAVDDRALYYSAYAPPATTGSRPSYVLYALPKDDAPRQVIRYLDQTPAAVSDGRCLYVTLSHSVTAGTVFQTLRLRLDGAEQTELWSSERSPSMSLDDDAFYLTESDGSIYRRPK